MHHLPRFFGHNNKQATKEMDQKMRRKPKLERRNAAKFFEYDAASSSSSLENSSHSLYTRSMDIYDRTSFRIEGIDGELDLICRSLGLSGPEDFAIPAQAWEDMKKVRSSSDVLPRLKNELGIQDKEELIEELKIEESNQLVGEDRVSIRDVSELGKDEVAESSGSVGIKGFRPPMIKPPPGIRLQVVDDTCSTWDILRDFAPQGESESLENISDDEKELERREEEGGGERGKVEEEEEEGVSEVDNVSRLAVAGSVGEFSGSCSFSTSIEDDTSSSSTGPRSTNISPNVRFRRIISNWQKGELLGRGSFGSVYEGISGDGFFFAVKEVSLLDSGSQGQQSVYQLEQEIALLSQFEHENIVQYYGTETDESKLYIFLELVTKGSLAKLYGRYNLRDSQVSAYTRQILHGLKYLHDRNVIHRDIKCANILVDASGSVKLADFGLAKATKLNDIKSCKGTPFWMAPEVVKGKNQGYGLPADMWSFGCTVLEMLTGQIPYSNLEGMQALYRIGKGERPPIPESLSKDARDFILKCLQVNPDERPTATALLDHPFVQRPLAILSGSGSGSGSASPYIPVRRN